VEVEGVYKWCCGLRVDEEEVERGVDVSGGFGRRVVGFDKGGEMLFAV